MDHLWDRFFFYLNTMDFETVFRWGWFIFLLDIPRFLLLEGVVLFYSLHRRKATGPRWDLARRYLWEENPLVTVLVPGHNEGKHLYKLIQSMQKQTYRNLEIIVVDDGSTDNTPIIGSSFADTGYIDRFLRAEVRGGKGSAANLGLRYAKGKFIVHLDADSSLADDAVEQILIPFYRYDHVGAVGGNLIVRNDGDSLTTTMQYLEYASTITLSRIVLSKLKIYKIVSGAFGAFPKAMLDRVGGWDVGPGLDGDITVKIRKTGYRILFEEKAVCRTHVPATWKGLTKQRLRWSRSIIRFRIRKHSDVLLPTKHFTWLNFISSFENILFNLVLDAAWIFYMFKIILENPSFLLFWIPFKYTLYLCLSFAQFFLALRLRKDKKNFISKIIYLPLYPLYMGYYLRIVRTIAYLDELIFFDSYKDTWNPAKTSRKARKYGG